MRPGYVLVEFPIEEAEALLERLDEDGIVPIAALADDAKSRIERAVNIERGPGGSAPLKTCTCGHHLDDHGQDGPMACLEEDCDCTDFRMFARVEVKKAA